MAGGSVQRAVWTMTTIAAVAKLYSAASFETGVNPTAPIPGQIDVEGHHIYLVSVHGVNRVVGKEFLVQFYEGNSLGGFILFDRMLMKAESSAALIIGGPPPVRINAATLRIIITPIPVALEDLTVSVYTIPLEHLAPEFS